MTNPYSLTDKFILVTGASSGIGKSIAIECSKMGAKLIITARNEERINDTFKLLEGGDHRMLVGDINDAAFQSRLIGSINKLDGIVLSAGIVEMLPIMFASPEKFKKIYETNLFSPIEFLRQIVKKRCFNNPFSVVAIDSIAGTYSYSNGNSIYGSGKAALSSFLKYFAKETATKGIRTLVSLNIC
jgi:NADP-dependent 3-hydroxy acid dehydrogenase YdfG